MANYAIITDLNRCTGCLACTVACKAINGVDVGQFWIKTLRVGPNPTEGGSGNYPDVEMYFLPVQCQHCENPQCVSVCPTEASHKLPDGTIQIDKSKCIGCQFCAMACPYGAPTFRPTGEGRPREKMEKCHGCLERIQAGLQPACVHSCPTGALTWRWAEDGESSALSQLYQSWTALRPADRKK